MESHQDLAMLFVLIQIYFGKLVLVKTGKSIRAFLLVINSHLSKQVINIISTGMTYCIPFTSNNDIKLLKTNN